REVDMPSTSTVRVAAGSPASIRSLGVVVVIAGSGSDELGLGGVSRSELGVPVAAAVDGELGDAAGAYLGDEDFAVGDLFAVVVVVAGELGDEAGHGGDG